MQNRMWICRLFKGKPRRVESTFVTTSKAKLVFRYHLNRGYPVKGAPQNAPIICVVCILIFLKYIHLRIFGNFLLRKKDWVSNRCELYSTEANKII